MGDGADMAREREEDDNLERELEFEQHYQHFPLRAIRKRYNSEVWNGRKKHHLTIDNETRDSLEAVGPQKCFRCSDAGKCKRMRILKRIGAKQTPVNDLGQATMMMGNELENWLMEAVEFSQDNPQQDIPRYTYASQGKIVLPEFEEVGHFDLLVKLCATDWNILTDIKSAKNKQIDWVQKGYPNSGYRMQVGKYALGITRNGFRSLDGMEVPPTPINQFEINYVGRDTPILVKDVFAVDEWMRLAEEDGAQLMEAWRKYQDDKLLPGEVPFEPLKRAGYRAGVHCRGGEVVPHPLCSPQYCSFLCNCPGITDWYKKRGVNVDGISSGKVDAEPVEIVYDNIKPNTPEQGEE